MASWLRCRVAPKRSPLPPFLVVAALLTGCGGAIPGSTRTGQGGASVSAPLVVAGDGVLCDLAQRLAAGDLRVECLLDASADPHSFQLQPDQKALLGSAQLVLINGYGLTPALAQLSDAVAVSELAVPNAVELEGDGSEQQPAGAGEEEHDDHEHEHHSHEHGSRDPHVWHDPSNAAAMVGVIADSFVALNPAARGAIEQRAKAMKEVLGELDSWNIAQFSTLPAPLPPLATGHRAFASLAQAYQLRELPLVDGFSTSKSLRPQAFRKVLEKLRTERVPQLFAEQTPAPRTMRRISELSGVPISPVPLVADGLAQGGNGPLSLVATLTGNTCTLVTGWGGSCDEAGAAALEKQWTAIP